MHRCKECADRLKRSQSVFARHSFLCKGKKKKKGILHLAIEQTSFSEEEIVHCVLQLPKLPGLIKKKFQWIGKSEYHELLFLWQ